MTSTPYQDTPAESTTPVDIGPEGSGTPVEHAKQSGHENLQAYVVESHTSGVRDIDQVLLGLDNGVRTPLGDNLDAAALQGDIGDHSNRGPPGGLDEAIARLEEAVRLTPDDCSERAGLLERLGLALESRFDRFEDLHDLEKAIAMHKEAVQLTPHGHPDRARYLANLGTTLQTHFDTLGDPHDLDEAAASYEESVQLTPHDHPDRAARFQTLGTVLRKRFDCLGDFVDLGQSISRMEEAVLLTAEDDPDRADRLDTLGISFGTRFDRLGDVCDIHQAIIVQEEALKLTPLHDPTRLSRLSNLSMSLRNRFNRLGRLDDVEQAIAREEEAVQLIPSHHPGYAVCLANLGISYGTRFIRLGNPGDLEQAITRLEEAIHLTPHDHPDRADRLRNLGVSLRCRFNRFGEASDLDRAIAKEEEAVRVTPCHHRDRGSCLSSLGISYGTRFTRFGDIGDLQQAIARQEEAVHLTAHDNPERPGRLVNLGISLQARFTRLYDINSLEEAIVRKEEAIRLTPHDHPLRPHRLASLGDALGTRFHCLNDVRDLDRAILMMEEAVKSTPDDDPDLASCMFNLGVCLQLRFDHFHDLGDLEQEITMKEKAVQLTSRDNPNYAFYQASLGLSFQVRFVYLDDISDLEHAIERQEEAVQLTARDHPDRPDRLKRLGNSFGMRFGRSGDVNDLNQAIARQTEAVQLTPGDYSGRTGQHYNLAISFQTRFDTLGDRSALNDALVNFSSAARCSTGPCLLRFSASQQWISCARALGHDSLADAYAVAVEILPQLAWIGLPLQHRYEELLRGADVVREAASVALELGHPETAVEWLEHGRFVVWNGILELRSPLDELRAEHPTLADKLWHVSSALERASARDQPLIPGTPTTNASYVSLEDQARQHRALAMERDNLLAEVHSLPGFERFLLGKTITQLKASAHSGPVVILNASKKSCDALIVRADVDNVLHIPLPGITLTRVESLQMTLEKALQCDVREPAEHAPSLQAPMSDTTSAQAGDLEESLDRLLQDISLEESTTSRAGKLARPLTPDHAFKLILSLLWTEVVKPVLDALGFSTPGEPRRIFWCPTGPFTFLPIHAAGLYDTTEPGHRLSDFVISSYTPTLNALAPIREPKTATHVQLLTVSQSDSDGQNLLPGTHEEMKNIKTVISSLSSPHVSLVESNGTVEDVLAKMTESEWVHFACHGIQDLERPVDSGLLLADHSRLKLSDMIKLSRPRGGLAFLSACQTATGDKRLSEEAVHLAAGMLLAGYSSVIATMWQIGDREAPEVAKDVYEELFRDRDTSGEVRDSGMSARALHVAVQRLRERGAPFLSWVPFVHIGL